VAFIAGEHAAIEHGIHGAALFAATRALIMVLPAICAFIKANGKFNYTCSCLFEEKSFSKFFPRKP
jgi:hypothetical protein